MEEEEEEQHAAHGQRQDEKPRIGSISVTAQDQFLEMYKETK